MSKIICKSSIDVYALVLVSGILLANLLDSDLTILLKLTMRCIKSELLEIAKNLNNDPSIINYFPLFNDL